MIKPPVAWKDYKGKVTKRNIYKKNYKRKIIIYIISF